jgi:hypothetical protein
MLLEVVGEGEVHQQRRADRVQLRASEGRVEAAPEVAVARVVKPGVAARRHAAEPHAETVDRCRGSILSVGAPAAGRLNA